MTLSFSHLLDTIISLSESFRLYMVLSTQTTALAEDWLSESAVRVYGDRLVTIATAFL